MALATLRRNAACSGRGSPFHSLAVALVAQLSFTDNAILHIRAVVATQPIVDPVVSVGWWKGMVDNSRNSEGAATWQTVEPARWYAAISDWGDLPSPVDRGRLLEQMHGFFVYRDERARSELGTLHITLTEAGLAVEHSAA